LSKEKRKDRCKFCQAKTDLINVEQTDGTAVMCRVPEDCINRANDKMRMQVYVNRNLGKE